MLELRPAAEAVAYQHRTLASQPVAHLGQPDLLTDLSRQRLGTRVETERTGQAAATPLEDLYLVTERGKDRLIGSSPDHRPLVAVGVQKGAARRA